MYQFPRKLQEACLACKIPVSGVPKGNVTEQLEEEPLGNQTIQVSL